jgi:hypothetical protein
VEPWSCCAAWLLSLLPLALEAAGHPLADPASHSRLALVCLPWIAFAGLPRATRKDFRASDLLGPLAFALPPVCAAFALDRAQGLALLPLALFAANAAGLLLLLALAAELAARPRAPAALYAFCWWSLLPASALLRAALVWGARTERPQPPAWLDLVASASPLTWCIRAIESLALARPAGQATLEILAVGAFVVALSLVLVNSVRAGGEVSP